MSAVGKSLEMDPLFLARSRLNRRKFDDCIDHCTEMLEKNPYDQVSSFLPSLIIVLTLTLKIHL